MTKLKNTKKGMAKKALSISLVAAMLATSNVPVWAAEDLFSDGSAAVEAPALEEEAAAEVETFSAEPAEETNTTAPLADNEDVTVDVKIKENGWGYFAGIDSEHTSISGLSSSETNVMYYWTVGGKQVTTPTQVSVNDIASLTYKPSKTECNGALALVIYRPDTWSTPFTWTSDSVIISKRDINKEGMTNINIQTKRPTYDGKEHSEASDWISAITFGDSNTELTYANGDFKVAVSGSKGLVNVDSDVTISITPADTNYYTGEKTVTLKSGSAIQAKTYEAGDIKVEYVGGEKTYNGSDITLKQSDFKVTDALSGETLDSTKLIYSIDKVNGTVTEVSDGNTVVDGVKKAGEYDLSIGLYANGSSNYTSLANTFEKSSTKLKINKLDLSTCEIFLGAVPTEDDGDAIAISDLTTIKITDQNNKVVYDGTISGSTLQVSSVQTNTGKPGTYTATVEASNSNTNFTGKSTNATFRVYKNGLGGAEFKGEDNSTNQVLDAEEYTGSAIVKDQTKLGTLTLQNGTKLTPGVDYDTNFVYKNNTNAGTASFVVKGLNSYAGSELTFTFTINKASVATDDVKAVEKVTYNSEYTKAEEYAPTLTVIGKNGANPAKEFTLEKDKDYKVEYFFTKNKTDKTTTGKNELSDYVCSKITITNNNFKDGTTEFYVYSQITKPQVSNWTVTTVQPSYTYTGQMITPELIVKDGTKELIQGYDYEIKNIVNGTDVGTATVILAGKGDYDSDSTVTTTFEITPAATEDLVVNVDDMEYTGYPIRPTFENKDGKIEIKLGDVVIDKDDFTITYPDSADSNKEIGVGTLTLTPKTSNKNFTGSKIVSFNIVGKKISIDKAKASDYLKVYDENGKEIPVENEKLTYNGSARTFADVEFNYIYKDENTGKSVTLEEGKDFEIKYFHNVYGQGNEKGGESENTAYIAVVGKGSYAGDGETFTFKDENGQTVNAIAYRTFKIKPVELTKDNITISNGTYAEGMPVKPVVKVSFGKDTLTLVEGTDYKLDIAGTYTEPTTDKKYSVDVIGINGYTNSVGNLKWGIDKKDLADCDITAYRDNAGNVKVTVMNGSVVVDSSKYVVTEDNDIATVTPAKDSKYYTGSVKISIQGEKPEEAPAAPMIQSVNVIGNNATVVLSGESDGATGYDYVISTDRDCITTKDYDKVNKNILTTDTTFTYTQQGVYYAYCHAWKRVDGEKVFSEWSNAYPFVVSSITPEQPSITKIEKSSNGKHLRITWTKSANATGYDVVMGTKLQKVNGEYRPTEYGKAVKKVTNGNTVSVIFYNIPKGTYYVGLHAYNRTSETGVKVFSPWSNSKKVTF